MGFQLTATCFLKARIKKSHCFGMQRLESLGHIVILFGITIDPEKSYSYKQMLITYQYQRNKNISWYM